METKTKDVALVLSSGGPRGFAYIGAIEELESRGYNITSVAGCSIGSLVGGIYAAGGLAEFKEWLFHLNNMRLMSLLDVSLSKSYLVKGQKVMDAIKKVVPDVNIEDMRIPYTAVSTDLYTGEEVVFREGPLFDAIRASISIPSLFRPVKYGIFFETKKDYGKDVVTGFLRLNGATVGAVANRTEVYDAEGNKAEEFDGTISARGARKAAGFVKFCDAFDIPVLTLTNVTGFKATLCSEKMIAKAVGEMVHAFADATVPKVNVVIGKAYGTAYVAMNSKSVGADLVYAWDNAEIGMMDASLAAKIMYPGEEAAVLNEKAAAYRELQLK